MHRLQKTGKRWWQKPLVASDHGPVPAELAVLWLNLRDSEDGVWINSRSTKTGVSDLVLECGRIRTVRKVLPDPVSVFLMEVYEAGLSKGCPDLVIWRPESDSFRFVEVKCPLWDRPTPEQQLFMEYASSRGVQAEVVEWIPDD